MQTLHIKKKGTKIGETATVKIIRSWQDAAGPHIFLHHNGTYADATGAPLKSERDFDILPPNHRAVALKWWERTGKRISEDYYAEQAQQEAQRAGDFQEALAVEEANSILDAVLYVRKPAKGGAVTKPQSWMEFGFVNRPDWWGQAKKINFTDYSYHILEPVNETEQSSNDLLPDKKDLK